MDLNEIKNRAKDLLADLTEPRPERDDRRDESQEDPAARTDRLSETMAGPVPEPADTRPGDDPSQAVDRRVDSGSSTDFGDGHLDSPSTGGRSAGDVEVQPAAGYRDEPIAQPAADFRDERVDRPAAAGMPEHRVLVQTREPVQPGVADTVAATDPAVDPGPVDDGRHHLREEHDDRELDSRELDSRELDSRELDSRELDSRDQDNLGQDDQSAPGAGATVAAAAASAGVSSRTETSTGDRERLVTAERAESYGSRWNDVKGEFVDEPRQAVAKADALVGELLDELGQLFADQRRGIEQDLDNNDASTEDLRVALRRYRSFFDRLLSV